MDRDIFDFIYCEKYPLLLPFLCLSLAGYFFNTCKRVFFKC